MRIVALLSWWNEDPSWLTRAIVPLGGFCHHLIAVDGAYAHMAVGLDHPASSGDQTDAIAAACDGAGLGLTMHRPTEPWVGDEVAKRSFMFRLAATLCEPGDWLFVIDADEIPVSIPGSIHERLEQADQDGLEVGTIDLYNPPERGTEPARRFFRFDPTLRVEGRHFHYVAGQSDAPRLMWGNGDDPRLLPSFHVDGFMSEHWTRKRHPYRRQAQLDYYTRRKRLELETDV